MIRHWYKEYWLVLLFAVAVSLIYGGGHLIHLQQLGLEQYEPLTVASDLDVAVTYAPRAKAVARGEHLPIGDINLAEYPESPAYLPMLNPLIMGGAIRLFGSLKLAVIVSDFVFPTIIFLLLYSFFFLLLKRKMASLVVASLFIFAIDFPFWGLRELLKPPLVSLSFSRFDAPQLTDLFYLPAAIFTYLSLLRRQSGFVVAAGVFAGALFYTDLYDWVTFYTGLLLLLAFFLLTRNWGAAKIVAGILGIGFLLSTFYWVNFFRLTQLPQYQDIATRAGVERSRAIRWFTWDLYLRVGTVIALLWALLRKRDPMTATYLIAFLLPLFVTLNLQVLTGLSPQPDHWIRPLEPLMMASLALIVLVVAETYLRRIPMRWWNIGAVFFLFGLFSLETFYVFRTARLTAGTHTMPEEQAASYRWIRNHVPPGSTIASIAPETNLDLQLYTDTKLFLPYGLNTIASTEEIWQRFFYLASLYHVPATEILALFVDRPPMNMNLYLFQNGFYGSALNSYFVGRKRVVPPTLLDEKQKRYSVADPVEPPFRLQYVYYGANEKLLGEDPQIKNPNLKRVYDDPHVRIYTL